LDGIVGVKGVGDPIFAVVVSMLCYLHFVSYTLTLTTFTVVSLHWWRLGSCVLSWVCDDIFLGVGSVSCIVGDVARNVDGGVGWSISCSIGSRDSCGIGSRIGRLHHFIFTSSLFSY
jgi:hypothetical protein